MLSVNKVTPNHFHHFTSQFRFGHLPSGEPLRQGTNVQESHGKRPSCFLTGRMNKALTCKDLIKCMWMINTQIKCPSHSDKAHPTLRLHLSKRWKQEMPTERRSLWSQSWPSGEIYFTLPRFYICIHGTLQSQEFIFSHQASACAKKCFPRTEDWLRCKCKYGFVGKHTQLNLIWDLSSVASTRTSSGISPSLLETRTLK